MFNLGIPQKSVINGEERFQGASQKTGFHGELPQKTFQLRYTRQLQTLYFGHGTLIVSHNGQQL